jgi:uncharacterized protein (TIGR01777 family)
MRVAVTGASGLVGSRLVAALRLRGDEAAAVPRGAAPPECDAVVHLAGEPIAQRWTASARREIWASREQGTTRLVDSLDAPVLVSASAVGYYGPRGDERLDEHASAGHDFLAEVCEAWETAALAAEARGVRVAVLRTGVVLDRAGGALARMLPPFRLGVGGPVAGGRQYVSWIALEDLVRLYLAALDGEDWSGPINATAPEPATNRELSKALGRALRRPALLPVPGVALRALYGDMAMVVTTGQRAVPARALKLGFEFIRPNLDEALRAALGA